MSRPAAGSTDSGHQLSGTNILRIDKPYSLGVAAFRLCTGLARCAGENRVGKGTDDDERGMDHSAHEDCVGCRNCGVLHVVEFGGVAATAAAVNYGRQNHATLSRNEPRARVAVGCGSSARRCLETVNHESHHDLDRLTRPPKLRVWRSWRCDRIGSIFLCCSLWPP